MSSLFLNFIPVGEERAAVFGVPERRANEADLLKIVHIVPDDIVDIRPDHPGEKLSPRILEGIVIGLAAGLGVGRLELTRGERVAHAPDRAEKRGKPTVGSSLSRGLSSFSGQESKIITRFLTIKQSKLDRSVLFLKLLLYC